jgi:hypothetical protein
LLLLVSLFAMAIGLIGGLHESYVQKVKQAGFDNVEDIDAFARKFDLDHRGSNGKSPTDSPVNDGQGNEPQSIHDESRTFDAQSAKAAYADALRQTVTPQFIVHLEQVRLDQINLDPIQPQRRDPQKPLTDNDIRKVDIGNLGLSGLSSEQLSRIKPLVVQMALRQWHENNKSNPKFNFNASDVAKLYALAYADPPGLLRLIFSHDSARIPDEQKTKLKAWINTWRDKNSRIQLSAAWSGTGDALVGRSIYTRLVSVRDEFIKAGMEPSAISIQIDRTPTPDEPHDVQILVKEQKK